MCGFAEDRDGHIVGVLIALLMAAATGRVADLFGAGKSRAAAVALKQRVLLLEQVVCLQVS